MQNRLVRALMNVRPGNALAANVGSMPQGPESIVVLDDEGNAMMNPALRQDVRQNMAAGGVTGAAQAALGGAVAPAPTAAVSAPQPGPVAAPAGGVAAPAGGQPVLDPTSRLAQILPMLQSPRPGIRAVAEAIFQQEMSRMYPGPVDPMDALDLRHRELQIAQMEQEIERARDPQPDLPNDAELYEYWRGQGLSDEEAFARVQGGPLVENNIGGDAPAPVDATLRDELQKNQADVFSALIEAGDQAAGVMADLEALRELSAVAPEGPLEGRFAQMFPEFNDVAAARNAIVRRVAPTLRAEGSGSTSDIEYAGMVEGLGTLPNSREVNVAIADMMMAKAQLDLQRADLIQQYQLGPENGGIGYNELLTGLGELNRQSIMPQSLRNLLEGAATEVDPTATTLPPDVGAGGLLDEDLQFIGR